MDGLTSKETLSEVQKLVDMCFQGNCVLDNVVYQMKTSLNTPKLYEFVHFTLSHALPIVFADAITDFMMERDDRIYRGALEGANRTYNNIIECLEDILKVFEDINIQISKCINFAMDNDDDKPVEDFLRGFLVDIGTPYWKQAKSLFMAAKKLDDDNLLSLFNEHFEGYVSINK